MGKENKKTEEEIPKVKGLYSPVDIYGKTFIVLTVCKDDLALYFTKGQLGSLDDDDMRTIAEKISDAIMACDYWDIVGGSCDYFRENLLETKKRNK